MMTNTKKQNLRRQRLAVNDRTNKSKSKSSNLSSLIFHVAIATIYSILRTTDAFRMSSIKRIGISSTSPSTPTDPTRIRQSSPSSSSSLYILSSPRRRTNSNSNSNSPSPIDININSNLAINFPEKNGNGSSPIKILASTPMPMAISTPLPPLVQTVASAIDSSPRVAISLQDTTAGAASKSSLFRRQHSSASEQQQQYYEGDNQLFASSKTQHEPADTNTITIPRRLGRKRKRADPSPSTPTVTEVRTVEELNRYWPRCLEEGEELGGDYDEDCLLPQNENTDPSQPLDYNQLLRGISVKGDTQIIGSKDHPEFVHPVVRLMHERKRQQEQEQTLNHGECLLDKGASPQKALETKKDKIALVVEGGGMRGCVSAGMVCAIHCLGLSDTVDVVYGSSAGAVIAAYFVSKQLPYYGPEVYYDSLTTMESQNTKTEQAAAASSQNSNSNRKNSKEEPNHVVDRYHNDYFIDTKRMTRSMGLGLCDPRLLKDVWTRRVHGKPMMNLHYMFQNIMLKKKPIDYETFVKRQSIQPLRVVATGLSSEKPFVLSHEGGHFDTVEDLCNSLHASCLLPGIAGPVMNVLKCIRRKSESGDTKAKAVSSHNSNSQNGPSPHRLRKDKPNFVLRNTHRKRHHNDEDYEPLGDAMLSAPIPYDIAHKEGATHVLVIRSSPDGTNLLSAPSVMAWIGSMIFKRYFLKKNHLPGMYKRSQTEQRHQRVYANTILELNDRANAPPPSNSGEHQTMTIALEPGSEEVSHLETTREGIFKGVRQGFARAYDALVEDPALRGRGQEMALRYFPDEILEYDPNDARLSSASPSPNSNSDSPGASEFRSAFEEYLSSTGVVPKIWLEGDHAMS